LEVAGPPLAIGAKLRDSPGWLFPWIRAFSLPVLLTGGIELIRASRPAKGGRRWRGGWWLAAGAYCGLACAARFGWYLWQYLQEPPPTRITIPIFSQWNTPGYFIHLVMSIEDAVQPAPNPPWARFTDPVFYTLFLALMIAGSLFVTGVMRRSGSKALSRACPFALGVGLLFPLAYCVWLLGDALGVPAPLRPAIKSFALYVYLHGGFIFLAMYVPLWLGWLTVMIFCWRKHWRRVALG
jgi:hypothetical protein